MLTKLIIAGAGIAAAVILAPTASANPDDLGNADVKATNHMSVVQQFIYCYEHSNHSFQYDDGLSDSSRAALENVHQNNLKKQAAEAASSSAE